MRKHALPLLRFLLPEYRQCIYTEDPVDWPGQPAAQDRSLFLRCYIPCVIHSIYFRSVDDFSNAVMRDVQFVCESIGKSS